MLQACLSLLIAGALAVSFSGCATASDKLEKKLKVGEPVARVYYAKYEEVEAAIKQAMIRYPQRVDNTEAGIFETDFVKGEARFRSPISTTDYSPGYRYRLLIRLVRGKNEERSAVKVLVTKAPEIARDFFATPESLASDGLEENVVLYRIGREIALAKAMVRATEKDNKKTQEKDQPQLDN